MRDDPTDSDKSIPDISSKNKKRMYEAEYKQAANLLNHSFDEYAHAENAYKKEAYHHVMDQALEVLKSTAKLLKREELLDQVSLIEQDLDSYEQKKTAEAESKMHQDIEKARKGLKK